jgi:hypothetical protein
VVGAVTQPVFAPSSTAEAMRAFSPMNFSVAS